VEVFHPASTRVCQKRKKKKFVAGDLATLLLGMLGDTKRQSPHGKYHSHFSLSLRNFVDILKFTLKNHLPAQLRRYIKIHP
jgi:hypothetical protein